MKVLVLGGGGREHALVWKLRQSPRIQQLVCAPGNGGIGDDAECQPADLKSLEAVGALAHFHTPVVVKADGLAAGKGVVIAKSKEEAASVASEMFSGRMVGEAGSRVVLEECLKGDELSFLVFSDGERVAPLVAAQDHK